MISDPFGENGVEVLANAEGLIVGHATLSVIHEGDVLFHIGRFEGTEAAANAMDAFEPDQEYNKGATAELSEELPIV